MKVWIAAQYPGEAAPAENRMSVAFTQTADEVPAADPGIDADGRVAGQSCGPVEHADAPTIDQSTQCPGDC